mgnify:CR=1 FL=1
MEFIKPHRVLGVVPLSDYRIHVTFEDNKTKIVDLSKLVDGEVFQPWKDYEYFKRVAVGSYCVVWPDNQDLCADMLYEEGVEVIDDDP